MSSVSKKRKIANEREFFKNSGRSYILSLQSKILVIALFVSKKIAVIKEYNMRRHHSLHIMSALRNNASQ